MTDLRPDQLERRRFPRRPVHADVRASLPIVVDVEILDLSESGVLLSSPWPLHVGDRVQVRTLIERTPVVAWVHVVRIENAPAMREPPRFKVAARFDAGVGASLKALLRK